MSAKVKIPSRIELWPIDKPVPYSRNARVHSEADVAELAEQIRRRGWTNPILVDEKGGVIAGHKRIMAARVLGLKSVPVIVLAHLSEAEKRAMVLADNQVAQRGHWDAELLRGELTALQEAGLELSDAAFSAEEIKALEEHPAFRPNLEPQVGVKKVTEGDIAAAGGGKLWREENLKTATCPACGHDFMLNPEDLK